MLERRQKFAPIGQGRWGANRPADAHAHDTNQARWNVMAAEGPIRPVRGWLGRLLLPTGADASVLPLLVARALRAFVDG